MKQRLLLGLMSLMSSLVYSQIQGPPAPVGYHHYHICDHNEDGIEAFDLASHFLFPFNVPGEDISNYNPLVFYLTEEDRNNEVNPIVNTSNYVNISNPQTIYFRAYAINPGSFVYLDGDSTINAGLSPTPNLKSSLVIQDNNGNGLETFNLTKSKEDILAGLNPNIYTLIYYENLNDAENKVNGITNVTSFNNRVNPQIIYVRVFNRYDETCFAIVELSLRVEGISQDIAVYLTSQVPPRPGFIYYNYLTVKNRQGVETASGTVEFKHDSSVSLIEVLGVDSGNIITNTSTGFILNFNNLGANQIEKVTIRMNVPIPTPLGALLTNTGTFLGNDAFVKNNTSKLSEVVIGSYDPNDILESHGPEILHSSFDSEDYLFYTVRFQNVGTADAINVSIDNTLNPKLDKSTIQMLSSSHTNVFTRVDDQLNWQFDNIHLPSESMDEPASHGYVNYKIKPLAGYKVGDIIPNTAEIYFDFNPAVITNTFETEFTTTLSNVNFNDVEFSLLPNPASQSVELKFNKNINQVVKTTIYDVQGKLILNSDNELQNNLIKLDVSSLKNGLYFLKVHDGVNQSTRKLIIE